LGGGEGKNEGLVKCLEEQAHLANIVQGAKEVLELLE
jgi:hypothetical protein